MKPKKSKVKEKSKRKKKRGCFKNCFCCASKPEQTEKAETPEPARQTRVREASSKISTDDNSPSIISLAKRKVSVIYEKKTSYYIIVPGNISQNSSGLILSHCNSLSKSENKPALADKKGRDPDGGKERTDNEKQPKPEATREEKDKLIRTILSKYLESKQRAASIPPPCSEQPEASTAKENRSKPPSAKPSLKEIAEKTSKLGLLDLIARDVESKRPQLRFPNKSKSTPLVNKTTKPVSRKSSRCYDVGHQESRSDRCIAGDEKCCGKKLELILNPRSAATSATSLGCENESTISLQYKISSEGKPLIMDILKKQYSRETSTDFLDRSSFGLERYQNKSESRQVNDSTCSLKWKLIISHHKNPE